MAPQSALAVSGVTRIGWACYKPRSAEPAGQPSHPFHRQGCLLRAPVLGGGDGAPLPSNKSTRLWSGLNWPDQAELNEWPDQATLDRILAAVQEHIPPNLDKTQLLADLKNAVGLYLAGEMLREEPSKRRRRGDRIIAAARRLKTLLDDGESPPVTHRSPRDYCAALDSLIGDIQTNSHLSPHKAAMLGLGGLSAMEQLVAQLEEMFEANFRTEAGYTRSEVDDDVTGIFIDFAEAVFNELGITNSGVPYSRRGLERALTKARSHRRSTGKTA